MVPEEFFLLLSSSTITANLLHLVFTFHWAEMGIICSKLFSQNSLVYEFVPNWCFLFTLHMQQLYKYVRSVTSKCSFVNCNNVNVSIVMWEHMWSSQWKLFATTTSDIFHLIHADDENEHFLASTTDELIPGNITFTETNRDPHAAAAAICSGTKPKGCNIELVRLKM